MNLCSVNFYDKFSINKTAIWTNRIEFVHQKKCEFNNNKITNKNNVEVIIIIDGQCFSLVWLGARIEQFFLLLQKKKVEIETDIDTVDLRIAKEEWNFSEGVNYSRNW